MPLVPHSPPKPPQIKYIAPLGTRWQKEKEAAGVGAFDFPDDPKRIGPWVIGECVGKGASGRVKIAKHRTTGQLAAVKILPLQPLVNSRNSLATQQAKSEKLRMGIDREITMMKLMDHPNIMRIYDVYEGETELYLVLEYVEGGELFDFLVNRGRLPPLEALAYFKQIIHGLNYAHAFSIVHRDLKPENILIHTIDPPLLKIADWGMAAFAPPLLQLETSCGSPHYASPEIINGEKYEGGATDIWSCGIILYALLTGRLPFDDKNMRNLLTKVQTGKYEIPSHVDGLARDLVGRMLVVDVTKRITIAEILCHPFFCRQTLKVPTPVPPPSIALLARPLLSPAHIDKDLLESLRIIWGRHASAEGEEIIADLLSPAGQGTLAKAFYFLLGAYRERTTGIVDDGPAEGEEEGKVITKQYVAPPPPKYKTPAQLGTDIAKPRQQRRRKPIAPAPPRSLSPAPVAAAGTKDPRLTPQVMVLRRVPSTHPASSSRTPPPVGPRPPTTSIIGTHTQVVDSMQRPVTPGPLSRKNSTRVANVEHGPPQLLSRPGERDMWQVHGTETRHAKESQPQELLPPPENRARQSLYSPRPISAQHNANVRHTMLLPTLDNRHPTTSLPPVPKGPQLRHSSLGPPSAQPAPFQVSRPQRKFFSSPQSPDLGSSPLPMFTSPRIDDAEIQRQIDAITDRVNKLNARGNAAHDMFGQRDEWFGPERRMTMPENGSAHRGYSNVDGYPLPDPAVYIQPETQDADARKYVVQSQPVKSANKENVDVDLADMQSHGNGGLGLGWMGREMGNVVSGGTGATRAEPRGKEKEKKSRTPTVDFHPTVDRKRSSKALSMQPPEHTMPALPVSILQSPALGEVKGWFSNLFNWKSQSYMLFSMSDMYTTKREARRILESFGVRVGEGEEGGVGILRCFLGEGVEGQRHVRFRVEFSTAGASATSSPLPASSHRFSQFSPNLNPSPNPNQGHTKAGPRTSTPGGYACAMMFIQEKGSLSTFRAVHRRVREEWRLDWEAVRQEATWTLPKVAPLMEGVENFLS